MITGMTAVHDSSKAHAHTAKPGQGGDMKFPRHEHPVVRTHPVSGRKALFVNRGFTTRIMQLKPKESDAVLEMLYRHVETPEFHCRFRWQVGSIAFWDNRSAQHRALFDYWPNKRYAHRVTVCGDKPYFRA
jgi:taurine dioxygenase